MGFLSRVKTWATEVLTYGDLNSEFDNILNNLPSSVIVGISDTQTLSNKTFSDSITASGGIAVTGDVTVSNDVIVSGGVETDGTTALKTKLLNIGDWDMDANATVTVAHGLTLTKIRSVTGTIRSDDDDAYFPLTPGQYDASPNIKAWINSIDAANINLERVAGSFYDGVDFNKTSYLRGWLIITYIT